MNGWLAGWLWRHSSKWSAGIRSTLGGRLNSALDMAERRNKWPLEWDSAKSERTRSGAASKRLQICENSLEPRPRLIGGSRPPLLAANRWPALRNDSDRNRAQTKGLKWLVALSSLLLSASALFITTDTCCVWLHSGSDWIWLGGGYEFEGRRSSLDSSAEIELGRFEPLRAVPRAASNHNPAGEQPVARHRQQDNRIGPPEQTPVPVCQSRENSRRGDSRRDRRTADELSLPATCCSGRSSR